ncbi:PAS domain S-box protein [Ginsengibacter hankyongi]|uniref:Oxygen sensor histidine kinase NreB n=1 Tax=Ginsengibacter hankyongi TaxID=2607284 RepID=A0A5J5IIT9_9BACT|nr:PAS domain S-box protein [Ginsengibacter hankyongi]KAA9040856.1 PAS domain S-box protein [Ginsengibacter hankyongi]
MNKTKLISILIIEDNPGDQLLLRENLLATNLWIDEIVMAETIAEGVRYLKEQNFAVIFLDLFLPDSRGIDTFLELIKANSRIPVIIYSGLSDTQIALKAIAAGAQDFLIKGDYSCSLLEKSVLYSIERKHILDALEDSNKKYDLVSKATHDMVWDWNLLTDEVYRNPEGWKKIFRAEGKEMGTKEEWASRIHPDDRERVDITLRDAINSPEQQIYESEFKILRSDNTEAYIKDRGYIVRDEKGKALRLIGAAHDITDSKNKEEELKKLSLVAKETINGVVIRDKDQNITWVNNAFTTIYGYRQDEVLGKTTGSMLHGAETDMKIAEDAKRHLLKHEPFAFEIVNYTKAGNKILVNVQVQPIFDDNGNFKQSFSLITDITQQRRLEEQVEKEKIVKQKEITKAVFAAQEKERSEIGRELHDNVNQLLGAVRLYIDMARKDDPNRESYLTPASEYTLTAIEEIRKLSKILITPLINEQGLVDSVKDIAKDIMRVHPIKISVITNDFNESYLSDKFKLDIFRILQEQINNTLKHAQAEKILINFKENNGRLLVSVSDDGIGFDTTARKNGVGITNIKSRAELYNGSMKLTSEVGQGTQLSITFDTKDLMNKCTEIHALKEA